MTDKFGLTITVTGGGSSPWTYTRSDGQVFAFPASMPQQETDAWAIASFAGFDPATPDVGGFGTAIFQDPTLSLALKLELVQWMPLLQQNVANVVFISAAWAGLIASLSISSGNQATIAAYAAQFNIPGI
jgi:hypothetical protein